MIKKIVLSLITVLSFCSLALAQNKQVTGTVTDEKGEPIIGATVVAEGTSAGTTTGGDGQFTLTVPANATLSISFIGCETQKVSVAGKTHIDVTLGEEATGIEDVVVIGYGTGKKIGSVIGSVDQVKSEKIENRPSTNVVDALQGQVAGLQIMTGNGELTSTSSIRIHGLGSMGADTSPLILLDGAPIQASTLQTINQNDIASVNVLKDASATSIYGSRAANGVIYVQTKTGRRNQESVDVTLTGQYSMSSAVAPELNMMSANEMLDYIGAAVAVRLSGDALTTPDKIASGRQYFIRNFGLAKFMDENYNPMNDYKWWNEILERNAPMYQVDLSVSGGSAKTSYYFSGNYANKTGILPGSELDRYNFRTNIDTRANNWLRLGLNLGLGYQHSSVADTNESMGGLYVSNPVMASLITPPYQPLYDDNGQMLNFFDATQAINPLMTADYMPRWQNRITMNGMAFIELTPVKGLTIRSSLAVDAFDWRSHGASSPETPTPSGKFGTGSASELFQRFYEWTWTNTAEYKHTWNEVHNFTALLGEETLYRNNNSFAVTSTGITSSRFLNIAMGTEVSGGLPTYSIAQSASNSVFGRLEYNFAERYFISGLLRNDASSRFGENNRNALFWAVGGMWNIKNETFLRDNQTISDLSLKVSYGTQGNSGIGDYNHRQYMAAGSAYGGYTTWMVSGIGNPDLMWESQNTLTVGANIELWRKLSLSIEYYRRQTNDMLMSIPLAPSGGYSGRAGNVGGMRNSGIDLSLNYDIYASKDWFVNFHATFNYNKNQLTDLWEPGLEFAYMGNGLQAYSVGDPFPTWTMQEWRGVDPETGLDTWTTADGGITSDFNQAALVNLGTSLYAPYTGGFGVTAAWKGLSLTADFSWVHGNYALNNTMYFVANADMGLSSQFNQCDLAWDYWQQEGDQARYPRLDQAINFDSRMLEKASFLRLKYIQLAYTLPSHIMEKTKFIKGLKVWVGGRNLWTVTGYNGLDPEAAEKGVDVDTYPNTREFTFGLEFKF